MIPAGSNVGALDCRPRAGIPDRQHLFPAISNRVFKMPDNKIILLTEIIDQRIRKEKELEFYQNELEKLQNKMFMVKKEIDLTNLIINIIQNEKVLDVKEGIKKITQTSTGDEDEPV